MMRSIYYTLTFEQPVVLSQTNATIGAHRSDRRVSGSRMLGAFAAALHGRGAPALRDTDDTFFHSDAVRFLDARPAAGAQRSVPVPLSYHAPSGGPRGTRRRTSPRTSST